VARKMARRRNRGDLLYGEEDCFFRARCATLQMHMAATRHSVHAKNHFCGAGDVIGVLQDKKVRSKLSHPKPRAIAYHMYFHFCGMCGVTICHG
jgi:hypothetical protein